MFGRSVMIAAVLVYLGVMLGCVLYAPPERDIPAGYSHAERTVPLPMGGVAFQLHRMDWMDTQYHTYIDKIRDVGANTVLFVVKAYQSNGRSNEIYLDLRWAPDDASLGRLIDYAHSKGLHVMLMPIVLLQHPRGDEWRGKIEPDSWDAWWDSYASMIWHFATLSESHKVDVLVVGSELVSTEGQTDRWIDLIKRIRGWYKGMLTYSANWDHYDDKYIKFWDHLDLIGINSYWTLGNDSNVSVDEIVANWRKIQDRLMAFREKVGRPVVMIEVGWCPIANAAKDPWDYTPPESEVPTDLDLQRKLYEGFFRAWYGVKGFGGFMIWEWGSDSNGRGYSPEGKPAERVLREWLRKPWPRTNGTTINHTAPSTSEN